MKIPFLLTALALILPCMGFYAQNIWAAEIDKDVHNQRLSLHVKIYRFGGTKDTLWVDWGDGAQEWITPAKDFFASGLSKETYFSAHIYEEPGIYEVGFVDSFLIEGVVNISGSDTRRIELRDSINILPAGNPIANNQSLNFWGIPGDQTEFENGIFSIINYVDQEDFPILEKYESELMPFPAEGYTEPLYSDSLYLVGSFIHWRQPLVTGIHALCIKIREFRGTPENPDDSVFMSTTQRAMMVYVDSSLLVSSLFPSLPAIQCEVFPNPATTHLHLQLTGFPHPATLEILDLTGRLVYRRQLDASPATQTHTVAVADWPPGVYLARVTGGGRTVTRKIIVGK